MTDFALDRFWEDEKAPPLTARGETENEETPKTDVPARPETTRAPLAQIAPTKVPQTPAPAATPTPQTQEKGNTPAPEGAAKEPSQDDQWRAALIDVLEAITMDEPESVRRAVSALIETAQNMTKAQAPDHAAPILSAFMARQAAERAQLRTALLDALKEHAAHPLAAILLTRLAALPAPPPPAPPPAPAEG